MPYSVIGFHYSIGGLKNGIGDWIKNANSKGIPIGLKGVDDYGVIGEAITTGIQHGVANHLVYRASKAKLGREVPIYEVNPVTDAQELAAKFIVTRPPEFDAGKVWVELINEPRGKETGEPVYGNMHVVDYLGHWCYAAAVYLNGLGYKFVGPSFNSGEPGDDGQTLSDAVKQYSTPGMLKFLRYCAENPDMAGLSVHDYIWDYPPPQYPQLWGRWEAAIAAADNAGIPRTFPIFVTEFGYSLYHAPTYPAVEPQLDFYNALAARFPQVKMAAAWTLQQGYEPVDQQINTWMQYPIDRYFDPGPQPAKTHSAFGATLPNGDIPMTWEQEIWQLGIDKKVLGFKTGAALQVQITADGYQALSNEYTYTRPDGKELVCQRAKHATEGTFRTYYCIKPDYNTVYAVGEAVGGTPTDSPF